MAFARDLEIGVDLEALAPQPIDKDVARRFFSPHEVRALFALPESEHEVAFLRCWTRKEAFIKARGDGLSLPLHDFDVVIDSSAAPALLRTAWSRSEPDRWSIFDLSDSCPGYVAALAVRARKIRVSVRADLSSFVSLAFEPGLTAALASASQVAAQA
jgi:4'-phosphopantetheinyl transferase